MKYFIYLATVLYVASCTTLDVYEKTTPFKNQSWATKDSLQFNFNITDTTSLYNFYLVLRHTDKYAYKNIWLQFTIQSPKDTSTFKREFTLADNSKWLGATVDDITDHRVIFNTQPISLKKGNYHFTVKQIMREDPLQNVLSAGVRVQKANQ